MFFIVLFQTTAVKKREEEKTTNNMKKRYGSIRYENISNPNNNKKTIFTSKWLRNEMGKQMPITVFVWFWLANIMSIVGSTTVTAHFSYFWFFVFFLGFNAQRNAEPVTAPVDSQTICHVAEPK